MATYSPVTAGRVTGRTTKLDGRLFLMVADATGVPMGAVGRRPVAGTGRRTQYDGYTLQAAGGSWTVTLGQGGWQVADPAGQPAAQVGSAGPTQRRLLLPAGALDWSRRRLRPQYRVPGLYEANRAPWHTVAPGFSRTIFSGTVTAELAARPDAPLALLLCTWLTWRAIQDKVRAAQMSSVGQPS